MEDYIVFILKDFIAENWNAFEQYCKDRGENLANEVYVTLGGTPDEE